MAILNKPDVLFLGGLFPKEKEKEIFENTIGATQSAANVLQWNLVEGLDANLEEPIKLLNALFIGSYPKRYKKLFIRSYPFSHTESANDFNVGFCNLSGFKRYSRRYRINRAIKKWAKQEHEQKVLFAYAMTDSSINAIKCAKKANPNIVTCLIVPDLPQYMDMSNKKSRLYSILKKADWKRIQKNLKYIDCFTVLTEQMAEFLGVDKYVVVEGIASNVFESVSVNKSTEKRIVYAGSLALKYGVGDLVKAFREIEDPNYKLILCGYGDAVDMIRAAQAEDNRIEYLGVLPREKILSLLVSATVLVNPRKDTEEYTKYSFPSKNLEYLSSGTPFIAYKLSGIPKEYDQYVYYVEGNDISDLKNTILSVCEKPSEELKEFGAKAKEFVLSNKNPQKQTEKILDMIKRQWMERSI